MAVTEKPVALTRAVSPLLGNCELTHLGRTKIDLELAAEQHSDYEKALEKMGYVIRRIPETPHQPDGVFVEDTAVVFPEIAIITRPGAESRRPETETMAKVLTEYKKLEFIQSPGTLDGGDVLTLGKEVYVGLSTRTNKQAIKQFAEFLKPFGYNVTAVPVTKCLHLKTAIAVIEDDLLLINPEWLHPATFPDHHCEPVHPEEPYGTNLLRKNHWALCSSAFPHTIDWLNARGYSVLDIDQSEMAKAEAGLTCCSVLIG